MQTKLSRIDFLGRVKKNIEIVRETVSL